MGTGAEYLAIMAITTTLVSTGVTVYGQMQQAQAAQQMAAYNARIQQQAAQIAYNNAMIQNDIMQRQNQLAQQQAQAAMQAAATNAFNSRQIGLLNQRASQAKISAIQNNALAEQRNAQANEREASLIEGQARERIRRQREMNDKALAALRAKRTRSDITTEGTPLFIQGQAAAIAELTIADMKYESDLLVQAKQQEARIKDYRSRVTLWGTQFEKMDAEVMALKSQTEQQMFALDYQVASYERAAALYAGSAIVQQRGLIQQELQLGMQRAGATIMEGRYASQASTINAVGSGIQGLGSAAYMGASYYGAGRTGTTGNTYNTYNLYG
jgi:hypothetical protein